MLPRPESSETRTLRTFPTAPGSMCWYVSAFFITAATWRPPLCANAEFPTKARLPTCGLLMTSSTNRDSAVIPGTPRAIFGSADPAPPSAAGSAGGESVWVFSTRHGMFILSARMGMMEVREALPVRSPMPLMVPWTTVAPAPTAAMELATARSMSLWQWMPSALGKRERTWVTAAEMFWGSVPPLVSQSTKTSALRAASRVARA
mmetsp:Transcript_337/g.1009  ORF Transcript_337/g.1009 Transcript_337/m.1009 type:complete len:205 (-) Transcript_337:309-923(-)